MSYGLPYMGSKSKILPQICKIFPKAENFYDLFGGGFSVTHFMIKHRSKDYKQFYFNEIRKGIPELIQDAISGKYNYNVFKPKWISREEFFEKAETDPYIKICWSFGNDGKSYMFGEDIEQYKKSMHNAIVFNEFDNLAKKILGMDKFKEGYSILDRRLFLRNRSKSLQTGKINQQLQQLQQLQRLEQLQQLQQLQQLERLEQLQRLEQLERLQQLERLERLQQLERLEFYNTSYDNIPIKENSIVYCDPPYKGTAEYDKNNKFNTESFLDWANSISQPVFISEYNIDDKRFKKVSSIQKRSMLNKDKSKALIKQECVYVNKAGKDLMYG